MIDKAATGMVQGKKQEKLKQTGGNMPRVPREPMIGEDEQILVTSPDEIDDSQKMIEMLESIAGEKAGSFKLYLHRASAKNRSVAAAFLKEYPPETNLGEIYHDAQTVYKGGEFVLVVREGNRIFKKAAFAAEAVVGEDKEPASVTASKGIDEAFDRISRSVEKSVLLDKVQQVTQGNRGGDANLTTLLVAMQQNQTEMMKLILPLLIGKKEERSSFGDLREMAVFLKNFQEGKIDAEGETSLTDAIVKALPAIAEAFARKGQPVSGVPALSPHPSVPPPGPGSSGAIPPPVGSPSQMTEIPDANKHPMAIAFNRVMAEIKFTLTLPETEKLYAHILDYTENYMPGSIGEMLSQSEDDYVKWIMQFDPSFLAREQFFRNVYKFAVKDNESMGPEGGEQ